MSNQIAQTILEQLGGNKFIVMTGAKNLVAAKDGLHFKIGRNAKKVTHVRITLNSMDLYNVEYLAIRGTNIKTKAEAHSLYADMLCDNFEANTGLYTSI